MSKPYKLLLFTILVSSVTIAIVVYRYEHLLARYKKQEQNLGAVPGGRPSDKQYTAAEIIDLIKKTKEYLGDSITIFDNGDILSSNSKFQGTIRAVIESKDNMDIVRNNAKTNRLPLQYNVYVLAATYYRQQYASEFKQQ
jgi:hypothetical protein